MPVVNEEIEEEPMLIIEESHVMFENSDKNSVNDFPKV